VEVDRRGLRQPVLDNCVEAIAAPRDKYRLRDLPPTQIRHIAAASEQRVHALDEQAPDRCDRDGGTTGKSRQGRNSQAARGTPTVCRADRGGGSQKSSPVHRDDYNDEVR